MFEKLSKEGIMESYFDSLSDWERNTTKRDFYCHDLAWCGGYQTYEEAYKAALSSSKYSKRIREVLATLSSPPIASHIPDTQPSMDVTGLGYDVGLALAGVPECWLTQLPSREPKVIRIGYNASISAGIDIEQIINRGVAVAALVNCLELAGISTEVVLTGESRPYSNTSQDTTNGIRWFITYKRADDYFDLDKFAWGICDPAFFRRLGFNWIYTRTKCDRYDGLPWPNTRLEGEGFDLWFKHMQYQESDFLNVETTKKWVIQKCREYGVEIGELVG
jgi:hypothetical protein